MNYKFSGHDTFQCKQQWLQKGFSFLKDKGFHSFSDTENAIAYLGVGKNMVQSLKFWLEAFYITEKDSITDFGNYLFGENGKDPFLEDEASLWLLQYYLCSRKYASIYHMIFAEYFQNKASLDFDEKRIISYIQRQLFENNIKSISDNTLSNDFKVFIKSYNQPKRELKTIEDDFNSPLIELNLIEEGTLDSFKINKDNRKIPTEIFGYSVIDILEKQEKTTISYRLLQKTVGNYFCLNADGLDSLIESLCLQTNNFVYNEDAGIAQLQLKNYDNNLKTNLLNQYYGN